MWHRLASWKVRSEPRNCEIWLSLYWHSRYSLSCLPGFLIYVKTNRDQQDRPFDHSLRKIGKLASCMALFSTPMMRMPVINPKTVPSPPLKLTPPNSAAVRQSNSMPCPVEAWPAKDPAQRRSVDRRVGEPHRRGVRQLSLVGGRPRCANTCVRRVCRSVWPQVEQAMAQSGWARLRQTLFERYDLTGAALQLRDGWLVGQLLAQVQGLLARLEAGAGGDARAAHRRC